MDRGALLRVEIGRDGAASKMTGRRESTPAQGVEAGIRFSSHCFTRAARCARVPSDGRLWSFPKHGGSSANLGTQERQSVPRRPAGDTHRGGGAETGQPRAPAPELQNDSRWHGPASPAQMRVHPATSRQFDFPRPPAPPSHLSGENRARERTTRSGIHCRRSEAISARPENLEGARRTRPAQDHAVHALHIRGRSAHSAPRTGSPPAYLRHPSVSARSPRLLLPEHPNAVLQAPSRGLRRAVGRHGRPFRPCWHRRRGYRHRTSRDLRACLCPLRRRRQPTTPRGQAAHDVQRGTRCSGGSLQSHLPCRPTPPARHRAPVRAGRNVAGHAVLPARRSWPSAARTPTTCVRTPAAPARHRAPRAACLRAPLLRSQIAAGPEPSCARFGAPPSRFAAAASACRGVRRSERPSRRRRCRCQLPTWWSPPGPHRVPRQDRVPHALADSETSFRGAQTPRVRAVEAVRRRGGLTTCRTGDGSERTRAPFACSRRRSTGPPRFVALPLRRIQRSVRAPADRAALRSPLTARAETILKRPVARTPRFPAYPRLAPPPPRCRAVGPQALPERSRWRFRRRVGAQAVDHLSPARRSIVASAEDGQGASSVGRRGPFRRTDAPHPRILT